MLVKTFFFMVLAAASTVTLAAPVPIAHHLADIQELRARWAPWEAIKSAAGSVSNQVSNAIDQAQNIYHSAVNTYNQVAPQVQGAIGEAKDIIKTGVQVYEDVKPIIEVVQAVGKREDELDALLYRREEQQFEW